MLSINDEEEKSVSPSIN